MRRAAIGTHQLLEALQHVLRRRPAAAAHRPVRGSLDACVNPSEVGDVPLAPSRCEGRRRGGSAMRGSPRDRRGVRGGFRRAGRRPGRGAAAGRVAPAGVLKSPTRFFTLRATALWVVFLQQLQEAEAPAGASAARLGGGGPEFTASGVPQEAFQPGDLAFPQIPAPARAPRPLFSPSRKHSSQPRGSTVGSGPPASSVPPRQAGRVAHRRIPRHSQVKSTSTIPTSAPRGRRSRPQDAGGLTAKASGSGRHWGRGGS